LKLSLTKFGLWATIAAVVLVLGAFQPGMAPERAEASMAGAYSVPSALPGTLPAIAPATAPGNIAVAVAVCNDTINVGLCPVAVLPAVGTALTFTLTRVQPPDSAPAARFGANNGTKLVCNDGAPCDLDTTSATYPLANPDGHVAVEVEGGGQNEVVNVEACDATGDCRNTRIIFVETIIAVSPLSAGAAFAPTLVSYACPVRGMVTGGDPAPWIAAPDNLWDLDDTVDTLTPVVLANLGIPTNRATLATAGFALPENYGPKWMCGTAAMSPQNRVTFETDAGILSVEAFVNPWSIGTGCNAGDSVDVLDYPNRPNPAFTGAANNQCDLDAFDSVVTYGLEGTGDVGVATLTAQQLGGGGPLRTINVNFAGLAAVSLFIDAPATVGLTGGEFSVMVMDQNGVPLPNQTVECTVAPTGGAMVVMPQTGTTDATGNVTMTLVPTGAAVVAGQELTLTCVLDRDRSVSASATINLSTVPDLEDVDLVAGCNPVSATWPDGTDASDVAAAVAPEDALVSIWAFDTASGTWEGYAPDVPAGVNDLETVDRLEAIFICVDADATVSRPVI